MAKGDDQFVEFVQASSQRLLHAAYLLTGDRHQAEDAVQTALARTYAAWSRVRRADAYSYTRRVLANHATDDVPERAMHGDVAHAVIERQWLLRALGRLTGRERAVVVMRHFFDLPEAEVASELKVSVGTVKTTNSRALAKLRISVTPAREGMA